MPDVNAKLHFDNLFLSAPLSYEQVLLYQVGDLIAKADYEVPEHKQMCDEISYIVSGKAKFFVNDKCYDVSAGDLIFCPYGSVHRIIGSKDNPVRYYYLGYRLKKDHPNFSRYKEIYDEFNLLDEPLCRRAFNINHLFCDLLCEFQQEFSKRDMLIELGILQIILHTYKYFTVGEESAAVYEKRVPDKSELTYEIVNFIDNNVLRIKSLSDISNYIGFSYSYTSQIFNSVMRMSLGEYYQKRRFEEAIKLLKGSASITACAEMLGFDTVNSFSRAFKNRFGLSPQKYMKQIK